MKMQIHRKLTILALAGVLAACGDDDSTGLDGTPATVEGRVEETTPAPGSEGATAPAAAPGADAETVAVVSIEADGALTTLAEAEVEADGSYSVEEVPAGRGDLAVVAYVGDRDAGRVLIHQRTAAEAVVRVAPINYESTAEARAWSGARASGDADATSAAEIALLLYLDGAEAEVLLASDTEIQALSEGLVAAGETLTAAYAAIGAELDAAARAEIIADAAIAYSESRNGGTSLAAAQEAFAEAALDGFVEAGVSAEEIAMATAAAASTLDATVEGRVSSRGLAISEAVSLNLAARERLAAETSTSLLDELTGVIEDALADTRVAVRGAVDAETVRAALSVGIEDARAAAIEYAVEALAADAEAGVQTEVAVAAEAAFETARLDLRLESATDAEAAAEALSSYRAEVDAAVADMIAASGATDVDADLFVSLFLATAAGAHVR